MVMITRYYVFMLFSVFSFMSNSSYGQIFAFVDSDGKLIISNKRENDHFKEFNPSFNKLDAGVSRGASGRKIDESRKAPDFIHSSGAKKYNDLINIVAEEVGVSPHLLHAVIQVESAYNPNAISSKGAMGLMQLIPSTAKQFGADQAYDPESNIRGGARFLKYLLSRFDNNLELTLAAYNAGEGAVRKFNNRIPDYDETKDYVTRVIAIFEKRNLGNRRNANSF